MRLSKRFRYAAILPLAAALLFAQTGRGEAKFDPASVCVDEKALLGSYSASVDLQDESVRFVFSGEMALTNLSSHRFPLAQSVELLELAAHHLVAADRAPDDRLVEYRPQVDRRVLFKPSLAFDPQVHEAVDLLGRVPREHLAQHGPCVVGRLQQPVHDRDLIAAAGFEYDSFTGNCFSRLTRLAMPRGLLATLKVSSPGRSATSSFDLDTSIPANT